MGGSKSKVVVDQVNKQINDLSMKIGQECAVNVDQTQDVTINNTGTSIGGSLTMTQTSVVDLQCMQTSGRMNKLAGDISNIISQSAAAAGVGITSAVGGSQANTSTDIKNIIENRLTTENINRTITAIKQGQKLTMNNSGLQFAQSINMSQGAQVFAAAVVNEVNETGIINSMATQIDQKADAKTTNPLDFLVEMTRSVMGAFSLAMLIPILFIIGLIVVIGFVIYKGATGEISIPGFDSAAKPTTAPFQARPTAATLARPRPGTMMRNTMANQAMAAQF